MVRFLYACLLRLHPRWFRSRYGEEMLWLFDEESKRGAAAPLLADAAVSLVRQWAFRSDFQPEPSPAVAAGRTVDGIPVFYTAEPALPRPSAMLNGVIASVAVFALISFAIAHGGRPPRNVARIVYYSTPMPDNSALFAGSGMASPPAVRVAAAPKAKQPAPSLWSKFVAAVTVVIPGKPLAPAEVTPPVITPESAALPVSRQAQVPPMAPSTSFFRLESPASASPPKDLTNARPATYIDLLPLLSALDSDSDGVLSAVEIAQAALVLPVLDANRDGRLSAEECGAQGNAFAVKSPAALRRARRAYMALHPVLAVLDADHNGTISKREIRDASAALPALDRNYDGKLAEDELMPDPLAYGLWLVESRVDRNSDGRISKSERARPEAASWKELLDASDADRDGVVTTLELTNELRRRADTNHSGVVTWDELRRAFAPRFAFAR